MTIPNITSTTSNNFYTQIATPQRMASEPITKQPQEIQPAKQETTKTTQTFEPDLFDRISEKVVNPSDINDMVKLPRTIFKGYLSFMVGTAMMFMAAPVEELKGFITISKVLKFAGLGLTGVGAYEFVKPFLLKPKEEEKEKPAATTPENTETKQISHTA